MAYLSEQVSAVESATSAAQQYQSSADPMVQSRRAEVLQELDARRSLLQEEIGLQGDITTIEGELRALGPAPRGAEERKAYKARKAEIDARLASKKAQKQQILKRQRAFSSSGKLGDVCVKCLTRKLERLRDVASYKPLTAEQLHAIYSKHDKRFTLDDAKKHIDGLNEAMKEFGINTPQRQASFVAQVAVESDSLHTFREYGKENDAANHGGWGALQITSERNRRIVGEGLGIDAVNHPEFLTTPEYAFRSAGYYWTDYWTNAGSRDMNYYADRGDNVSVSRGVQKGFPDGSHGAATAEDRREAVYNTARQVLGVDS